MAQVYVTPERRDDGAAGLLTIILLIVVISFIGIIAYNKGWFSMSRSATTDSSAKIKIMTPAEKSTPAPESSTDTTIITPTPTTLSDGSRGMRF